jgi:integrase
MACVKKRRGRYVLDFYDQHGHRQRVTMKAGTTKKQAEVELRSKADAVSNRAFVPVKRMLLFSKVAEEWLEHKKPNLRITSWNTVQGNLKNHYNELKGLKIGLIDTATIEKWICRRQAHGMNINTLRKLIVTLNQVMAYGVRHRYTDRNPVTDAERPREQGQEPKQDKISVLKPEEIKGLLKNTEGQKYQILLRTAIFTGMRQGELLGLKWNDIDWENKQVHVQRTYTKGMFFDVKTKTSNRRIDLGPSVIQELRSWERVCPANDLGLVFPNEEGRPMNYSNMMNRHFIPALIKAGIAKKVEISSASKTSGPAEIISPKAKGKRKKAKVEGKIRFHDLRHTYASLLIAQGENIKYIQAQMGHSSPMVTLNVYAHLMNPTNQAAACRLEDAIFSENRSQENGTSHKMVTNAEKELQPEPQSLLN